MIIGLAGAHRTGKTTLAREYASKTAYNFLPTSASSTFERLGMDPKIDYPLETRLAIQTEILLDAKALYESAVGLTITDRTPIDMAAYMMADISRGVEMSRELELGVLRYLAQCAEVTKENFSMVVLVQPGIPLVESEGKAPASRIYIEHINHVIMGLMIDGTCAPTKTYSLSRMCQNLQARIAALNGLIANNEFRRMDVMKFEQKYPF